MTIGKNWTSINDKQVILYNPEKGISDRSFAYRVGTDWEGPAMDVLLKAFFADPKVSEIEELIIGSWTNEDSEEEPDIYYQMIIDAKDKLPNLRHLFLGDITYEENEMSWINQGDIRAFVTAFPGLESLRVRGGGAVLEGMSHANLKSFALETGGMRKYAVQSILAADFPKLEHLELWLGVDNYGWDGEIADFKELFEGKLFPNLRSLGINNAADVVQVAEAMKGVALLDRIEALDFSGGMNIDELGQNLLDNPKLTGLKSLNLRRNFFSDAMAEKLQTQFGDRVNLSERESNSDWIYIEVGE